VSNIEAYWEQIIYDKKGPIPLPMSHHSAFIYQNKLHCYGGLIGSQSNGDLWILDLRTSKWEQRKVVAYKKVMKKVPDQKVPGKMVDEEVKVLASCEARDDHSAAFDEKNGCFYIFGGYVNGDKSNDLWKFDLNTSNWTCLAEGDYQLPI